MADNTPTIHIKGGGCAAIICVLLLCLAVIIVTGYGASVWNAILVLLGWAFTAWLWLAGIVAVVLIGIVTLALLTSRS